MNNKGWARTWREQFTHEISEQKPWCDGYAWTFLYCSANHKDGIANFRNQYIPVERGQLLTSKLKLQATFGWTRRRLDSFLKALEIRKMCTIRTTNRFIIITIQNYDIYQPIVSKNEQTDLPTDVQTDVQTATYNQIKKNNIFIVPTVDEIKTYCIERNNTIDPQYFFDYQTARDWKLKGGQKIKDWKAVVRTWEKNDIVKGVKKTEPTW